MGIYISPYASDAPTSAPCSVVVCAPANTTLVTRSRSKSSELSEERDGPAAFLRESSRRVAIIEMKITLELFSVRRFGLVVGKRNGFSVIIGERKGGNHYLAGRYLYDFWIANPKSNAFHQPGYPKKKK